MAIKTFDDVVVEMLAHIELLFPDANLTEGSFNREVFVDAPSNEIALAYSEIAAVQNGQSIQNATGDHLDRLLANWAIYRQSATKAIGSVYFRTRTLPTTDIVIPSGTRITTPPSAFTDAIEFVAIETVVMYANPSWISTNNIYNASDRVYEVQVEVQAVKAGAIGNVGPRAISIVTSISSIDSVLNKTATSGGTDKESDDRLRTRGLSILSGVGVGTIANYEALVESYVGVDDAIVVDSEDRDMVRAKDGGGVDIWITTTVEVEAIDTYNYIEDAMHIFTMRPVTEISQVVVNSVTVIPTIDYEFVEDVDAYGRSMYSRDSIRWINPPSSGARIDMTYQYCSLIRSLQNLLDGDSNHSVGADIVVKKAYVATINIIMYIEVLPGFEAVTTSSAVNSAIVSFIDNLSLGIDVQQSDIVSVAENVLGVDSVALPLTKFDVVREDSPDNIDSTDCIYDSNIHQKVNYGPPYTGNLLMRRFDSPAPGEIIVNAL